MKIFENLKLRYTIPAVGLTIFLFLPFDFFPIVLVGWMISTSTIMCEIFSLCSGWIVEAIYAILLLIIFFYIGLFLEKLLNMKLSVKLF